LGFATLENVLYVFNADGHGLSTAFGRAFTAIPAHAAFGVLMGAYIGLAKFFPEKRTIYTLIGVGLAIFFHGAYDFFLMQQVYEGMAIMAIFTLVWGISMSRRLIKVGQELSPFKNKPVEQPLVGTEMVEEIEGNQAEISTTISEENTVKKVDNTDFI
jgi:protease PrsW